MKDILHILQFEWKAIMRSKMLKALLWVMFGAAVYGIYFGKFEIEKQHHRIAQVQRYEQQQFDSLLHWAKLDTLVEANQEKYQRAVSPVGVGWNKHFTYYVAHTPPPLAGLCLGQRDLFPVYYGFNVTDLARQVNVGELANPMKLLTGNFDLSYVIIFLLPLLIVALFYNLYAGEKESGTLSLLQSQPVRLGVILFSKALLRLLIVMALLTVILAFGFILQGISLARHFGLFLEWLLVIYGYCLLWALIMGAVVWLRQTAALSAMLGLGIWLVFTLVAPALLNLMASARESLPRRAEVIHAVRALNDKSWQSPKSFVFDKFYPDNPRYDQGDTTDFQKWYYASFTLLDAQAHSLNRQFEEQVTQRNQWLDRWLWLAPAAMVHEKLSATVETGRNSHLRFLQKVESYHGDLKDIYYPKIFSSQPFRYEDLLEIQSKLAH